MASKIKGELKIEFYAHLGEIKDLYFNQGIVIFKILHEKVVNKFNLTISYKMFCYYAKKELKGKELHSSSLKKVTQEKYEELEHNSSLPHEPIIAMPKFPKAKRFNPNADG